MKKRTLIFFVLFILIFIAFIIRYINFGTKEYIIQNEDVKLEIPRFSVLQKNYCKNCIYFKTLKSKSSIKSELNKILNSYEIIDCNYNIYYYNKKNDITVKRYVVESAGIFNKFSISYYKGKYTNDECNVIGDSMKLEYKYYKLSEEQRDEMKIQYEYLNKDGKIYNVFSDCNGCLQIKKGMGYYEELPSLLWSRYISMQDLLDFLDYQVENKKATKEIYKDGGTILYKNKDFALLKCNTIDGNQDIYISDILSEYKKEYCK